VTAPYRFKRRVAVRAVVDAQRPVGRYVAAQRGGDPRRGEPRLRDLSRIRDVFGELPFP